MDAAYYQTTFMKPLINNILNIYMGENGCEEDREGLTHTYVSVCILTSLQVVVCRDVLIHNRILLMLRV